MSEATNSLFESDLSSQIFDELGGNYNHTTSRRENFGNRSMEKKHKKLYDGTGPKEKIEIVYPEPPRNVGRDIDRKRKVTFYYNIQVT